MGDLLVLQTAWASQLSRQFKGLVKNAFWSRDLIPQLHTSHKWRVSQVMTDCSSILTSQGRKDKCTRYFWRFTHHQPKVVSPVKCYLTESVRVVVEPHLYRREEQFVASWRYQWVDLNDLHLTGCWISDWFQQPAACYILIVWAGADIPSSLPPGNLTPAPRHSGDFSVGWGTQPNNTATQACNLSSSSGGHTSWKQMNSHLCCNGKEVHNSVESDYSLYDAHGCYGVLNATPSGTSWPCVLQLIGEKLDEKTSKESYQVTTVVQWCLAKSISGLQKIITESKCWKCTPGSEARCCISTPGAERS